MLVTLDIDLAERELDLPASVSFSREDDVISDRSTRVSMVGPGAEHYWPDR